MPGLTANVLWFLRSSADFIYVMSASITSRIFMRIGRVILSWHSSRILVNRGLLAGHITLYKSFVDSKKDLIMRTWLICCSACGIAAMDGIVIS